MLPSLPFPVIGHSGSAQEGPWFLFTHSPSVPTATALLVSHANLLRRELALTRSPYQTDDTGPNDQRACGYTPLRSAAARGPVSPAQDRKGRMPGPWQAWAPEMPMGWASDMKPTQKITDQTRFKSFPPSLPSSSSHAERC